MKTLAAFADDLLFDMMAESPDLAASMGVREIGGRALPGDRLTDFSDAGAARRRRVIAEAARDLNAFDRSLLSPDDVLTFDLLRYFLDDGLFWLFRGTSGHRFAEFEYPASPFEGVHATLLAFLTQDFVFAAAGDVERYLVLLAQLPQAIAGGCEALKARAAEGHVSPRLYLDQAAADIRGFLGAPVAANGFVAALERGCRTVGVDGAAALARAAAIIEGPARQAYEALLCEIEAQAERDVAPQGLWAMPDGEAHYAFLLSGHTTTRLTPDEVHRIGRDEVETLTARIDRVFASIGMTEGTIGERYTQLAAEPAASFRPTGEGRAEAEAEAGRLLDEVQRKGASLFERLPRAGFRIEVAPEALEDSTISHYTPPQAGGGRPGVFTFNVRDSMRRLRGELAVLCYHEIFPGHHLQLALAQELTHLPAFRRTIVFTSYVEGWAKYAETLPETLGLMDDPRVALCRMRGELYSTVNLVLDTGVNAKRWSRKQAIEYFVGKTGAPQGFADMIAARSILNPGQLCSYKIGMLKMLALKDRLARARGPAFDVREFHRLVLHEGALPLSMLEARIDAALAA